MLCQRQIVEKKFILSHTYRSPCDAIAWITKIPVVMFWLYFKIDNFKP